MGVEVVPGNILTISTVMSAVFFIIMLTICWLMFAETERYAKARSIKEALPKESVKKATRKRAVIFSIPVIGALALALFLPPASFSFGIAPDFSSGKTQTARALGNKYGVVLDASSSYVYPEHKEVEAGGEFPVTAYSHRLSRYSTAEDRASQVTYQAVLVSTGTHVALKMTDPENPDSLVEFNKSEYGKTEDDS